MLPLLLLSCRKKTHHIDFYCYLCFWCCSCSLHHGFLCCAGFWTTSGCIIYCQTLQHEQKQSGQPVLQRGGGGLHLHCLKTLPEFEAHRLRSSGNCLVRIHIYTQLTRLIIDAQLSDLPVSCFRDVFTVHGKWDTGWIPIWSLNAAPFKLAELEAFVGKCHQIVATCAL